MPSIVDIFYGFGDSEGYKSFEFFMFVQGLANETFWIDPVATSPFQNQTQILKVYAEDHWSEENQNLYALWPRLSSIVNENNTQRSTWFMKIGRASCRERV